MAGDPAKNREISDGELSRSSRRVRIGGMARFKRGFDLDQGLLLPVSLREWLPEDHLAWFVLDTVARLDIDALLDRYRMCGKGELAYDPRMMLGVLLYAYATGTFSSRKIAAKLETDVAFRVLSGNQLPAHRSICRFRSQHLDLFTDFFVQVVQIGMEAGLTKLGTIAIDGSKVKANASKHRAMSYERMKEEEARLRQEIAAILKMVDGVDAAEDGQFGPDFRGDELPKELRRREDRVEQIAAAKERLEKRKAEQAQQEARAKQEKEAERAPEDQGKKPRKRGRKPKYPPGQPKPKDQENFTDPDSRIMKSSSGFEQGYNAQIAVAAGSMLIVATGLTNNAADNAQLVPMIEAAAANTGEPVKQALADAGYRSEENFTTLEAAGVDAYVSLGREGKEPRLAKDPDAHATKRMGEKLKSQSGRERYRKRKGIVEPVFGWVKNVLGFRAFSMRGIAKVTGEWNLVCLALNLRRMATRMT